MENKIVSEEKAKSELRNCFRRYLDNYYYFSKWYKENANTYYFIFKKNLKVTNIQYAELISLIKRYSKSNFENEKDDVKFGNKLQFLTVQQFNNAIAEIVSSFDKKLREFTNWENKLSSIIIRDEFNPNDKKIIQECSDTLLHLQNVERDYKIIGHKCIKKITDEKEKEKVSIAEHLTEVYYDMIRHVVIVDAFHGSCVLFINPTIHIPIDIVCAYSGYISDCGKALFIRDVDKAKKEDLKDDLKTFMEGYKKTSKKKEINFCVFSHEEFTNEKSSLTKELHGKEGLKIYFEKFYMGADSLINVYNYLKSELSDYGIKFIDPSTQKTEGNTSTIWLLVDHIIEENYSSKGLKKFYICYQQLYKNRNQLHLFDEDKPGWIWHTTMPHTLTSSMINIALSKCDKKDGEIIKILDPFGGTGTTALETLKFKNVRIYHYDMEGLSIDLLNFNKKFFSLDHTELNNISESFKVYLQGTKGNVDEYLRYFLSQQYEYGLNDVNKQATETQIRKIKAIEPFEKKLVFYLLLKSLRKNTLGLTSDMKEIAKGIDDYFFEEIKIFNARLEKMISWVLNKTFEDPLEGKNLFFNVVLGEFSLNILLDNRIFEGGEAIVSETGKNANIYNLSSNHEKNTVDIIVADPPYGFNDPVGKDDHGGNKELSIVYKMMVENMVESLSQHGQIIMALPDKSFSGKYSPYFTHKEIVIQQFISYANRKGYQIINIAETIPSKELFSAPYFWESEKALRRSIIHLKINK